MIIGSLLLYSLLLGPLLLNPLFFYSLLSLFYNPLLGHRMLVLGTLLLLILDHLLLDLFILLPLY